MVPNLWVAEVFQGVHEGPQGLATLPNVNEIHRAFSYFLKNFPGGMPPVPLQPSNGHTCMVFLFNPI